MLPGIRWSNAGNRQMTGNRNGGAGLEAINDRQRFRQDCADDLRNEPWQRWCFADPGCGDAAVRRTRFRLNRGAGRRWPAARAATLGEHVAGRHDLGLDRSGRLGRAPANRRSNRGLDQEHHKGDHQTTCRLHTCTDRNTGLLPDVPQNHYHQHCGTTIQTAKVTNTRSLETTTDVPLSMDPEVVFDWISNR